MRSVPTEPRAIDTPSITLKQGRLYIPRAVHDGYFTDLDTVILLRSNSELLIMPVRHAAAGGYVSKVRNSAGDRIVEAIDYFRAQGMGDDEARELMIVWSSERAALVARDVF